MTGQQVKEAFQHKRLLRSYLESGVILDAAEDWINGELASIDKEMRKSIIEEMKESAGQGGLH